MPTKDEKIIEIYKKYAPKNITLSEFREMVANDPSLLDINGKFSTFDPELATIYKERKSGKKTMSKSDFRMKLSDSISDDALDQVVSNYQEIYADIIRSNDDVLVAAWTFDTLSANKRESLARKIIDEVNKRLQIEQKLKFINVNPDGIRHFKESLNSFLSKLHIKTSGMRISRSFPGDGYYTPKYKTIVMKDTDYFLSFINILSHEYGHFIDHEYPDLGMLGAQIANYSSDIYFSPSSFDEDHRHQIEKYRDNPTEVSSYSVGPAVRDYVEKVLEEQKRAKPNLYITALKKGFAHAKLRLAALRFKYNRDIKAFENAKQDKETMEHNFIQQIKNDKTLDSVVPEKYDLIREIEEAEAKKMLSPLTPEEENELYQAKNELFERCSGNYFQELWSAKEKIKTAEDKIEEYSNMKRIVAHYQSKLDEYVLAQTEHTR